MEVAAKPKRRKSKQRRSEETAVLIESSSGNEGPPCDDIALSPLSPTFPEKEFLLKSDHDLQRDSSTSLLEPSGSWNSTEQEGSNSSVSAPPVESVIEGLCRDATALAIAPELDLMQSNFDNYIRKEDEAPEDPVDVETQESRKHLIGCNNIEEEFIEVTKAVAANKQTPCFTEGQLLSLYHNEEIGLCNVLVESFLENELRSGFAQRHPLYDLLNKYLKSRDKLNSNVLEIEALIKETKDIQQRLWLLEVVKVTESGECQDGNPVEASHEYKVGTFDEGILAKLTKTLAIIREKANEQHALHSYSCLTTKLQIENYVRKLIAVHSNLPHNAPVTLMGEGIHSKTSETCGAVSVLFAFLRQFYKDQGFVSDCRNWLQNIVATLLRIASWREHMFLLNHVLRCPSGVSSWATCFVQTPVPPFDCVNPNMFLDHMVCLLSSIIGPIKQREMFLPQLAKSMGEDDMWVLVDSEGEDEEPNSSYTNLSENDVIAIFNQIPMDCLFGLMFHLQMRDGKYILYKVSSGQLLKTMAVTRLLMKILSQGFFEYNSSKYQQFSKRLATTLVHATHFLTDVWDAFRRDASEVSDEALMERLQVEYDNIVKSACKILISSPQKSVLQFLINLPYDAVTLPTLWQLLQLILQPENTSTEICESPSEWWDGIEELVCSLNDAESCYILTAVCNMALSRSEIDWSFIKIVAALLLQVGIINNSTRDVCHKTVRTQLSNMTHVHPSLTSLILHKLKHFVPQAGNLTLYLFRELPLHLWKPTKEDIELLEHWLLACPQGSIEGSLAIYVLYKMNWGLNPSCPSQLFLPRELHCLVALLVVRLAILHCPESPTSSHSTVIADTIKQLTSSSTKLITDQTLNVWIWSMLFKLRLHLLDQPEPSVWATLANPLQFFSILPSLESLPSELSPLIRALKENQVTAVFTALLMTSTGHSIPLICHSGFNMLEILIQCHRYLAVLVLIEHIFPLFIESPGSLLMSEKFLNIVTSLMAADRTFLKFAMSLISSAFPGLILKQFGDLIEVHLKNYKRYNLTSPAPLAEMWMRVLAKAWLAEPIAASYLMDKILSVSYFRPDMKATALGILHELLEQSQASSNKQRFSLLNWVTGNNPYGTLMNKTSSDTPWFTLFAIEVEQNVLFLKTTLWDSLLIDLSTCSGKPSIDSSLKKCCTALKLSSIPSSTLPIYRWSQQVLETPVDHPAIPIFWQKFFALFLARVPTISRKDVGSVGLKFYEGITNNSLLTKLKKKLQDCKEFYETKCKNVSAIVPQDKRAWYCSMVDLYGCYTLWLDDPSLHDPSVNLYALPASYCPDKLSTIFSGDEVMWMEFVDHEALQQHQRQTLLAWQQCLYRATELTSKPVFSPKVEDPLLRIEKRLAKFESPIPPPTLKPQPVLVTDLPTEVLFNKHHTMEYLKDSFKALTSYAQVYWLRSGELSSVDFSLLELAPQLYRTVETQVTLHAACDTHNPGAPQQSSNSLICAGPAVIHIKVNEAHVDSPVDMAIHNNRQEAQNLIKRCLQQPNQAVCIGSIQVQEVVRVLEEKCNELRRIGDVQLLIALQDVGVSLFYHMTNFYTEKTVAYPPMKQLLTSCVETLGQFFICVDEQQGPVILAQVLENPNLASLLSTHFAPTSSSPQTYILLYRTLINAISASNADLIFVLLTKFDVGVWLDTQKPRLSDRSQLIEVVCDALASSGQDPSQEFIIIHEVLRRQLCALMMADCSQHLPQVLQLALRHSESHSLSSDVWFDIVNALVWHTGVQFKPHGAMSQVVSNMATFSTQQTLLSLNEIKGLITLISKFFTHERLQYGLYGLYPKYRSYVSAFTTLLGVVSHALVASIVRKHSTDQQSNVCSELWPPFLSLFTPWICPYFTQDLTQPTAAWIQQLTDDRSILLPWITADSGHAHKITAIFTESIRFLLDILPGNKEIFGYVWQFYVTNFAHTSVKEHILTVINNNLLSLNWQKFTPTTNDLELMLKVSDTYVPCCHTFLGAVFIEVPWNVIVESPSVAVSQQLTKVHATLLQLFIKLSIEPNVRQSGKIGELLRSSKSFHWETVDAVSYESVVNWFVMSYDPRVVLNLEQDDSHIDQSVMELLRYAAGFAHSLPGYHNTTPRKRQCFVRAYVKLIISCLSKYKAVAASHQSKVESAIEDILILINTVVPQTGGDFAEAGLLVTEVLTLVNLTSSPASKIATDTIISWTSKRGDCIVAAALLRTVGPTVEQTALIGEITEAVLEAVFNDNSGGNWDKTLSHLQEPIPRNPPVENHLVPSGQLLTLYAFLSKKLTTLFDLNEEMDIYTGLTRLISALPPMAENAEKVIPVFHLSLIMAARLSDANPIVCDKNLRSLVQTAESWADYKPSWGFLGAIIKRQNALSIRMKAVCRVLCALILIQLPEGKSELPNDNVPFIRTTPQSPGGFTSNSTELGPSGEAHKALSSLETCINDKAFAEIRSTLEIALGFIRRTETSLHNAHQLFLRVVKMLYPDTRFIQGITIGT